MSKTEAELEAENEELRQKIEELESSTCANCGFNSTDHKRLVDASVSAALTG